MKKTTEPEIILPLGTPACKNAHEMCLTAQGRDQGAETKGTQLLMILMFSRCQEEVPISWDDSPDALEPSSTHSPVLGVSLGRRSTLGVTCGGCWGRLQSRLTKAWMVLFRRTEDSEDNCPVKASAHSSLEGGRRAQQKHSLWPDSHRLRLVRV